MNEHDAFEVIKNQLCKEIEEIAEKVKKTGTMSESDLDKLDKLYHTKKDLLATYGMENPEEFEGFSGRRGRSSVTGRFVSRDGGQSYAEGYSQGYNEAMSQTQANGNRSYSDGYNQGYSEAMRTSGHYPMNPMVRPYY